MWDYFDFDTKQMKIENGFLAVNIHQAVTKFEIGIRDLRNLRFSGILFTSVYQNMK